MFEAIAFIKAHGLELVGGIALTLSGLYTIALVIPGEQPDKAIKAILDLTNKFSRK